MRNDAMPNYGLVGFRQWRYPVWIDGWNNHNHVCIECSVTSAATHNTQHARAATFCQINGFDNVGAHIPFFIAATD